MSDAVLYFLVGLVGVSFFMILLTTVALFIHDFTKELRFLNMEIGRTDGEERTYWKRRRRRLWLSLLPFINY